MERMLQKLAQQLNAYDEASLMSLWDRYAAVVDRFEPTKRWEEAALVLSRRKGRPRPRRRASGRERRPEAAQGAQLPAARGRLVR